MTAKNVSVLIDSKYWDRNLSFVAFTRHKQSLNIYTNKTHHASQSELLNTLSRRSIRDNVIDWPLDFATRAGFSPDKLIGRVLNRLVGVGHKIKQGLDYVVSIESEIIKQKSQDKNEYNHVINSRPYKKYKEYGIER